MNIYRVSTIGNKPLFKSVDYIAATEEEAKKFSERDYPSRKISDVRFIRKFVRPLQNEIQL